MIIVNARPYDDKEIVETYLAELDQFASGNGSPKGFEKAWDAAVNKAKSERPETWCLDEVIKTLKDKGWQIIRLSTISVTY